MSTTNSAFNVGNATIRQVIETGFSIPQDTLFPGESTGPNAESALHGRPAVSDPVHLSVHTWVVEWHGRTILIDTCIGNCKNRPFSKLFHQLDNPFLQRLAEANVLPGKVDYVLHTHLHTDHVGWNTRFLDGQWRPTFPNAQYVFSGSERDFYATPAGESRRIVFDDSIQPVIEANQAVLIPETGGEFMDGIVFHPTPGHSPGHMAIAVGSGGQEALFTGDLMHSPIQVRNPDWNSVFCLDPDRARASRRWLLDYAAGRDAILFPAHFPKSSAGRVTAGPDGMVWNYV